MEIFRSMAKSALRISSLSKVDPAFANWKSQFTDDQKRAAFLSSVRPLDTQNSQQWATYGLACEFLDQREDAISAYDRVLALRKTHSAVRLRLYKLTKNTDLLAPLKLSEYSLSGTLVSDAPPSDILRHLDTTKRKGREKANLNWVLPLVSQWQGEDYKKLCQAMLEIPALAEEGFSRLVALEPDRDHLDHARTARTANARAFRALRSEDYGLPSPRWQSAPSVLLAHDETTNVDPALLKLYQADPDDFLTDATTYTNPRATSRPTSRRSSSSL